VNINAKSCDKTVSESVNNTNLRAFEGRDQNNFENLLFVEELCPVEESSF